MLILLKSTGFLLDIRPAASGQRHIKGPMMRTYYALATAVEAHDGADVGAGAHGTEAGVNSCPGCD